MATNTLQDVFDAARGYLHDTQVAGGETWQNSALQVHFAEPYRRLFSCLMGSSKRVQRIVYVNFPGSTTVLVPQNYAITDMSEPELIEERPATAAIAITNTGTATPIQVNAVAHGLGSAGTMVEGTVSGVAGTTAPWGNWFVTIIDANNFTLNGSRTDGVAGTGGTFTVASTQRWCQVDPIDLAFQGLDGVPQQYLGSYLWINEQLQFRGAIGTQQLRITYWASGDPPTNANTTINIDNCIDFLALATAANAARANGWYPISDALMTRAYGATQDGCTGGALGAFIAIQVATLQRGPQRRRLPFRFRKSRFGDAVIG